MKILFFFATCLPIFANAQSVYQLLYVQEGTIQANNTPLKVGKYYKADLKVKLQAKRAIFYDTIQQELATVVHDRIEELGKLSFPVRIEGFKCCVSGFASFLAHHLKPYPILYPNTILHLEGADEMKYLPHKLAYKFWDTQEKRFRMKFAPIQFTDKGGKAIELFKIIETLQAIQQNDIMEPFFFYKYDEKDANNTTLIKERSLKIIDTEELKLQIGAWVEILRKKYPQPTKANKEQMLSLLSDFVHEICGYPDEFHFKKWLKEHFNLDLYW